MGVSGRSICAILIAALISQGALYPMYSAYGAYDHPVTWADMSNLDLRTVFRSQYASQGNLLDPAIPASAIDLVLRDADARVSPLFHVPEGLRGSVEFWLRIYTEFTTQHVAIFDSRHPEIIYEVIDLRKLALTARNRVAYEISAHKKIQSKMNAYRRAFAHLARNKNPKRPTQEEQNILQALRSLKHHHPYLALSRNLRAQTGQRDNIIKGLLAAESFFPKMESIFSQLGVPPEVTRLSLVESSFNMGATSRVGAAGVWQFMPGSARQFLLLDDAHQIDERLSPLKSTIAAARLLQSNFQALGTWPLAITAYNHGMRGLPRIRGGRGKSKNVSVSMRSCSLFIPCSPHSRLGWASRNYYAEFLAVLHAEAYRNLFYGEPPSPNIKSITFLQCAHHESIIKLSLAKGISLQELRLLNPDIRNIHKDLPDKFWVAIPAEQDNLAMMTDRFSKVRRRSQHPVKL